MDILSMCRICLVKEIPLRNILNTKLQDMYEKLTEMPFETKSRRPLYICYICCAKLSNCIRLQTKCLQSEEIFNEMSHNNKFNIPVQKANRFRTNHPFINISFTPDELNNSGNCDDIKKEPIDVTEELEIKEEYIEDLEYDAKEKSYILAKDFLNLLKNADSADELDASDYSIQAMQSKKVLASRTPKDCENNNIEIELMPKLQNKSSNKGRKTKKYGLKLDSSNPCGTVLKYNVDQRKVKTDFLELEEYNKTDLTVPKTPIHTALVENQHSSSRKLKSNKKKKKQIAGEYKCDICEKSFTFKSNLNRHLALHIGSRDKPYKCDVCDKSYVRNAQLREHKRVHTGEKPYKCTLCGKDFSRKCYLRQHNLVHYPESRHKCNICDKSFNRKGNLIEHARIHTGEKPYKCDVCE